MNKTELVAKTSLRLGKSKKQTLEFLDALTIEIQSGMVSHGSVGIYGFGTFKSALQKGKTGKTPGSDKIFTSSDKMVPRFIASRNLKYAIQSGE